MHALPLREKPLSSSQGLSPALPPPSEHFCVLLTTPAPPGSDGKVAVIRQGGAFQGPHRGGQGRGKAYGVVGGGVEAWLWHLLPGSSFVGMSTS